MTYLTCRLTSKHRDQLRNLRLGNRVWATITIKISVTLPHRYTGTHMPYGITQCYLLPGRDDILAFTPAEAVTRFSYPGGMQG